MAYEFGLAVDELVAIDTHVHIEVDESGHNALPQVQRVQQILQSEC